MTSSLPNKQFEGQTGFPTPNAPPDETGCRVFSIPADEEWFALFMSAALTLTDEWRWFKNGTMTQEEAAAAWSDIIDQAYAMSLTGQCGTSVPAPYWDDTDAGDADDEEPVDDQEWYGEIINPPEGITWREQVGIWAITAFVAIAATPAAAIAFLPVANRFTLAFKQHDLGGIVRVLIDAVEVATVDTYAPSSGVINVPITTVPSMALLDDPPVLWVVMSEDVNPAVVGAPNIQVLRKRLTPDDVSPANIRWNEDCDCVQQTPDDGATWVDTPEQDPRHAAGFRLPALTGPDIQCDAAERMTRAMNRYVDTVIDAASILEAVNGVLAVILIVLPGAGVLVDLFIGGVTALFGIGLTAINLAMTDMVYDQIMCILYCHLDADGQLSAVQLGHVTDEITATIGGIPEQVWRIYSGAIGEVGLSNAGVVNTETGDCDDCGCAWCYEWDFTLSDGGFIEYPGLGEVLGHYVSGQGWVSNIYEDGCSQHAYVYIRKTFGFSTDLVGTFEYDLASSLGGFDANVMNRKLAGSVIDSVVLANGDAITHGAVFTPVLMDGMDLITNRCGTSAGYTVTKARVKGFGEMPAFTGGAVCE